MSRQAAVALRAPAPAGPAPRLQRKCACDSTGESCARCSSGKMPLQRKAADGAALGSVPPIVNDVLASPGQPMDASTRGFMEGRFGHDFSGVRIHADSRAEESAQAVSAKAYTVGQDVVFGQGHYAPATSEGKRLFAHELAHVVQQGQAGNNLPPSLSHSSPGEQEADRAASAVEKGSGPVRVGVSTARGLARQEATEDELTRRLRELDLAQRNVHKTKQDSFRDLSVFEKRPPGQPPTNAHTRPAKTDPMKFAEPTAEELARLRQAAKDAPAREAKAEQDRLQAEKERADASRNKNQQQKDFELSQRTPPIGLSFLGPAYVQAYYRNPSPQIQHPLAKQQADLSTSAVAGHGALGTTALAIATGTVAAATVLALGAISFDVVVFVALDAAAGSATLTPIVTAVISNPMSVEQIASFGVETVLSIVAAGGIKNYLEQISTLEGALHLAFGGIVIHAAIQSASGGPPRRVTFKGKVEKATPQGIDARITDIPHDHPALQGARVAHNNVPPRNIVTPGVGDHPTLQGGQAANDAPPRNVIPLARPQVVAPPNKVAVGQSFDPGRTGTQPTLSSYGERDLGTSPSGNPSLDRGPSAPNTAPAIAPLQPAAVQATRAATQTQTQSATATQKGADPTSPSPAATRAATPVAPAAQAATPPAQRAAEPKPLADVKARSAERGPALKEKIADLDRQIAHLDEQIGKKKRQLDTVNADLEKSGAGAKLGSDPRVKDLRERNKGLLQEISELETQRAKPFVARRAVVAEHNDAMGVVNMPARGGGSHTDVRARTDGGQVNHIPAWDSYKGEIDLKHGEGPGIWMTTNDHAKLKSTGSSDVAVKHRATQRDLISKGRFDEAVEMDVADIKEQFKDGRYDDYIVQMRNYISRLDRAKLKPGGSK